MDGRPWSYQLEFPAGMMHETEDPEHAARRELEEETGYTAAAGGGLHPLGSFYSLPSETNKYTHVYLARGAGVTPAPGLRRPPPNAGVVTCRSRW
jgi:8-oxo-dGTP pyrophosphatase MutT (NUDIX family)